MKHTPIFCMLALLHCTNYSASNLKAREELNTEYTKHCTHWSDIYEHLPVLKELASECSSVVEIGTRSMVSTWGILEGLVDSSANMQSYTGIDLNFPPEHIFNKARDLAYDNNISFHFIKGNDMQIDLGGMDMLFIDSLHTYCHLTYELEKFAPKVNKYIAMHDTSAPWGDTDDTEYHGNYSEYPAAYDKTKRGLWPAVEDFLSRHPEWELKERRLNNHGFTVLQRVK